MRKKGFTLIELLVVISIIAMLLAILMPALNKVKKIAMRVVCATNLKGMGTAQMVYGQDYDDDFAVQGGRGNQMWADNTTNWDNSDGDKDWSIGEDITVGASLYLLVREADVPVKAFICPSGDETEFSGANENTDDQPDIIELWDFGNLDEADDEGPIKCVSYSYQMPYAGAGAGSTGTRGNYAANGTSNPGMAIMADKNPFFDNTLTTNYSSETITQTNYSTFADLLDWENDTKHKIMVANAESHGREAQNVLFADGHTAAEKRSDVGVQDDNIYVPWASTNASEDDLRRGLLPTAPVDFVPLSSNDSVLVNDVEDMNFAN